MTTGSCVLLLNHVLLPVLRLLVAPLLGPSHTEALSLAFAGAYNLLWLLPAYAISFLVNCIWYNEIAELVVAAAQRRLLQQRAEREGVVLPAREEVIKVHRPDMLTFLSQEVYRLLLTSALFVQVLLLGLIPVIGPPLGFVGMSWLYALYCFDYKWSLHSVPLEARLRFFEQHWAFFAGFGAVTVLPMMFGSFYTGAALVGVLFPLFIMLAADSSPKRRHDEVLAAIPGSHQPTRVPVFWAATRMANWAIDRLARAPALAAFLGGGRRGQQHVAAGSGRSGDRSGSVR
ncbi:hypothetical protein N2152v2_008861 [Parachlorella kessleri]